MKHCCLFCLCSFLWVTLCGKPRKPQFILNHTVSDRELFVSKSSSKDSSSLQDIAALRKQLLALLKSSRIFQLQSKPKVSLVFRKVFQLSAYNRNGHLLKQPISATVTFWSVVPCPRVLSQYPIQFKSVLIIRMKKQCETNNALILYKQAF